VNPPENPRKTSRLWIILGVILFVLVIAGGAVVYLSGTYLAKAVKTQNDRRARLADLEAKRRELTDAARTSVEEGNMDGMAERLAKFGESVGNAADGASGTERQSLRAAQRVLQSMAPSLGSYEAALKELQSAGFARPQSINSREAIAARVALVKKFGAANDNLSRVLEGLEARVRVELEQEGVPVRDREKFVSGFIKASNMDLNRTIRQCDRELTDNLLKMLALLDREWGTWKMEGETVIFNRPPVIQEFNGLTAELNDIAERQSAAQQEMLNRAGKR
jgi:hypothetical protein